MFPFARSPSKSGHEICTPKFRSANQPLFWQIRVVGDPAGQSEFEACPQTVGNPLFDGKCQVAGLKERGHRRHQVGACHANAFAAGLDDRLGRANGRTNRVGGGVVGDGRDEGLERFGVERARQHERLVDCAGSESA